jgi:hypothetical protein
MGRPERIIKALEEHEVGKDIPGGTKLFCMTNEEWGKIKAKVRK